MKKIIIIIAVVIAGVSIVAAEIIKVDVPVAVKSTFASLYPDVKKVKWSKENGNYEAEFKLNGSSMAALFNSSGTLVETETEIDISSLPEPVSVYITKNFKGKKIQEAARIVDAAGKITYEVEVGNEDYLFDENGNLLGKENEDNGDGEDDNDNDDGNRK